MNDEKIDAEPVAPVVETEAESLGLSDDKCQTELETMKDRHLRLQADFDNFRKRTHRERIELHVRATEDLVKELLPILDNFEIGLRAAASQAAATSVVDGFQMVYDQLQAALRKVGLVSFEATGMFDPHQHEAVSHVPSPEHAPDTIVTQTRRGYRLGEKLLRPAQVIVSSGTPEAAAPSAE